MNTSNDGEKGEKGNVPIQGSALFQGKQPGAKEDGAASELGGFSEAMLTRRIVEEVVAQKIKEVKINEDYTQLVAQDKKESGEADVLKFHDIEIQRENTATVSACERIRSACGKGIEFLTASVAELARAREQANFSMTAVKRGRPWTIFSIIEVGVFTVFALLLVLFGLNTISNAVKTSGIFGFDHPWLAYIMSLLPIGLAFLLHCAPQLFIQDPRTQIVYRKIIWGLGIGFTLLWVVVFAEKFPKLTVSTDRLITDVISRAAAQKSEDLGADWFIVLSIVAESLVCCALVLTARSIIEAAAPASDEEKRDYERIDRMWRERSARLAELEDFKEKVEAKLLEFERTKASLLMKVRVMFRGYVMASAENKESNTHTKTLVKNLI